MGALPKTKMTVTDFLDWWEKEPDEERYELVDGEVFAMGRDRARHNLTKMRVVTVLSNAIQHAGVDCTAFIDGIGVSGDEFNFRLPDAIVHCGPFDLDTTILDNPVIVVEVVSPTSEDRDVHAKLADYFTIPSVSHYLIIYPDRRQLVHHWRKNPDETVKTSFCSSGAIELSPPGIVVEVEALFGEVDR